ncbi:hypothetical protein BD560DRAFT_396523 [Blakeslea trispora]|nr:hypothetical protein BD560DRAFT_396523 [Blakeslea trispora]
MGFEMSIDPFYTFIYKGLDYTIKNDTGLPCHTIPITDELINYVEFRGPEVMNVHDLDLIGNCSSMSYCDKHTKTCQPKMPLGSSCRYNMQCYFGIDGIPGHCSNKTCSIRQDIPQYYYNTPRWSMGDQWQAAVIAVLITGGVVISLLIGRVQVKRLAVKVKDLLEKWQNPDDSATRRLPLMVENEEAWNEYHHHSKWWKQLPGINWIYNKLNKKKQSSQDNNGEYYQLNQRTEETTEQPPPYREG